MFDILSSGKKRELSVLSRLLPFKPDAGTLFIRYEIDRDALAAITPADEDYIFGLAVEERGVYIVTDGDQKIYVVARPGSESLMRGIDYTVGRRINEVFKHYSTWGSWGL